LRRQVPLGQLALSCLLGRRGPQVLAVQPRPDYSTRGGRAGQTKTAILTAYWKHANPGTTLPATVDCDNYSPSANCAKVELVGTNANVTFPGFKGPRQGTLIYGYQAPTVDWECLGNWSVLRAFPCAA
jgi:hypothetical protein